MHAQITHVIFDMDGLLLDTESLYSKAIQILLNRFGHEFTFSIKEGMMGRGSKDAAAYLVEELKLPATPEEIAAALNTLYEQHVYPDAVLMPGAEKLIVHLHKNGIPIAVCTGSHTNAYEIKTHNHKELFDLFRHVVRGDDPFLKRTKPHPDPFQLCIERFHPQPLAQHVLVFEDAPNGVQAALAAGAHVVMVPDARYDRSKAPATVRFLDSLLDFEPASFNLPAF